MEFISTRLPYRQTGTYSKIVLDYIDQSPDLKDFYAYAPNLKGVQKAIEARKQFPTDRKTLVAELKNQYSGLTSNDRVKKNIDQLLSENCFVITTAHQPNILTGPLYFIYKIFHAIKLADHLNQSLPDFKFVPVYYMGSEDADIAELGNISLEGKKRVWKTKQTGAVGRMKVDKEFLQLVESLKGQLEVLPFGKEVMSLVKDCFKEGTFIQQATLKLVNEIFGEWGLVVIIPDSPAFKKQMKKIFENDLLNQQAAGVVEKTSLSLEKLYKIQINPREINLFYLEEGSRERIEMHGDKWKVLNTNKSFSKEEIIKELNDHPDKFSPNVVLRGLFQETILPGILFTGGGGELSYWLQLRDLFAFYKVPFPVLLLRNSFLIIEKKWRERISKLGFRPEDLFLSEQELMNRLVARESKKNLKLNGTYSEAEHLYGLIKKQAGEIDISLEKHVDALKLKTIQRLHELEKKMLRAEKRKFSDQQRQIHGLKEKLFPGNGLQERTDNILYYYAQWGRELFIHLFENSLALEQEFVVLQEK